MKKVTMLFVFLGFLITTNAQKILKEAMFDPDGKAKISNLSEVQVDEENNQMTLFYITKSTGKKVKAEILYFDLDFNFIRTESIEEDIEKVREKYRLKFSINFCPESREPLLTVEANLFTGQTTFKKGYIENYLNWSTGYCDNRFKVEEKVKPKGEDGERLKLVNYWTNNDVQKYVRSTTYNAYSYGFTTTFRSPQSGKDIMSAEKGDVVICAFVKEKGMAKESIGKNYVFEKFSVQTMEKTKSTKLDFPVAALPLHYKFLTNGNIAYLFQRADAKYEYVEVDFDGEIQKRLEYAVPNENMWVVNDFSEDGDNLYVYGVTSKVKMNAKSIPGFAYNAQSFMTTTAVYADKPNGYQLMKISANKIEWVSSTGIKDFATTFVNIGKEKGKPFTGGKLSVGDIHISPNGSIMLTGQKKNSKNEMLEVVAFDFSSTGKLISNYSTKLRKKNDYNKLTPTKHALMNAADGSGVYWTIFEVAGAKKSGIFSGENGAARILYYPRVTKIANDGKSATNFIEIGNGDFFLDDNYPINALKDNKFIFIGADKSGKKMWFSKVQFD